MAVSPRWTLALASVAALMVSLDALVVTTALNTIRLHLGASIEQLEWTVNAYTLAFAVLLLTASAVGDRIGRRRLLLLGLTVFTAASAACALAPSIGMLIGARAVQGAGAAMVMPAALALVGVAFPAEKRGAAMGIFGGVTGLAVLGGPVVGGAVVQGMAWQWIFWLNVPIGVVLIPLARRRIAESSGPARRLDVPGLLASGLGLLGVVWALIRANSSGWAAPSILGALVGGFALLVVFVLWQRRARSPMLPPRLFARRAFCAANGAGLLLTAAIVGTAFFFAQDLQAGLNESPLAAGVHMLPWTATLFLIAPIAGARINRIGERRLIVAGLLAQAVGFACTALAAHKGYPAMIAPMMLAGIGVSSAMPAAQSAVLSAVDPQDIGIASGVYNALRQLGAALGIAILSAVFTAHGGFATPHAVNSGFKASMIAAAILSAFGALAGLGADRLHRPGNAPTPDRDRDQAQRPTALSAQLLDVPVAGGAAGRE